ncbi:DUF2281 domain-containing protein [Synechococcus elongatus]|uniref:DUF2281 domain-containing protein n=1 Tax=Synechococcus elongatus TaxID=32046 RepID=UPI000F7E4907|nr:DUF2281 domain-containing protein [Synechococcus elongatus]
MNPAQIFEKLQALPPDKQAEVFDFIEFLASRSPTPSDREVAAEDWNNAGFSQLSMSQAMRGMEDEPSLYSLDDLKERWG